MWLGSAPTARGQASPRLAKSPFLNRVYKRHTRIPERLGMRLRNRSIAHYAKIHAAPSNPPSVTRRGKGKIKDLYCFASVR